MTCRVESELNQHLKDEEKQEINGIKEAINEVEKAIDELEEEINETQTDIIDNQEAIDKLDIIVLILIKEAIDKPSEDLGKNFEEFEYIKKVKDEIESLKDEIQEKKEALEALEDELEEKKQELEELEEELEDL